MSQDGAALAALDEYDENEWRDIMRHAMKLLRPDQPELTDEEFHADWLEFQEFKRRKQMQ